MNDELVGLYKETQDQKIYEKLLKQYTPLFHSIIKRNKYCKSHKEDMLQEMALILFEAINSYDMEASFTFFKHLEFKLLSYVYEFKKIEDRYVSLEDADTLTTTNRNRNPSYVKDIIHDCIKYNKLKFTKETLDIMKAYYVEGYTLAELGALSGCSFEKIRLIKSTALKEIIEFYKKSTS